MKPASPELLALLATRQFYQVDLYTIALANNSGGALYYCSGDADVTCNGIVFSSGAQSGPYWDRKDNKAKLHQKIGTGVDQLVIDCLPGTAQVLGSSFFSAIRTGVFDAAIFTLDRLYMPTYGDTSRGAVRMFVGRVAEIDAGRVIATFTINSHLELFNQQLPRNLYEPSCINSLGDTTCLASVPSYSGTASSGSSVSQIVGTISGAPSTVGVFDLGTITMTSGALDGFTAGVASVPDPSGSPTTINLQGPLPNAPAAGDTFTITFGCNKSLTDSNGCPKFSNQVRFRGFPFVPQPVVSV